MRLLLLRNKEEAIQSNQNILKKYPCLTIDMAPLFEVDLSPFLTISPHVKVVITSKNAIKYLAKGKLINPLHPLYLLGESSAQYAKQKGFQNIQTAQGNARSLALLISQQKGAFLYLRGQDIRFDLCAYIKKHSSNIISEYIAYKLVPIKKPFKRLSSDYFKHQLTLLIYSQNQAHQALKYLPPDASNYTDIIAISHQAALPFISSGYHCHIAAQPNEISMIDNIAPLLAKHQKKDKNDFDVS